MFAFAFLRNEEEISCDPLWLFNCLCPSVLPLSLSFFLFCAHSLFPAVHHLVCSLIIGDTVWLIFVHYTTTIQHEFEFCMLYLPFQSKAKQELLEQQKANVNLNGKRSHFLATIKYCSLLIWSLQIAVGLLARAIVLYGTKTCTRFFIIQIVRFAF